MWYKVRLNPECGAHSSSTLLKSQGRHDARLLLRIWQVFDSVRPSQVTSSVILQPCRWSLIVIDVRPTTKDKRCTALPFRLSWPVSALHFMAIMSCTNLSCTSIQPTNEQMGACCVASRAHVRLGLKHRSSFIRKLCSVRVPGYAHVIASHRSRAAVALCREGGSFGWIGPGRERGRGRELVSVSGSNHMGGSDDERVWEKKMMDRRQRKVKGVEVYI